MEDDEVFTVEDVEVRYSKVDGPSKFYPCIFRTNDPNVIILRKFSDIYIPMKTAIVPINGLILDKLSLYLYMPCPPWYSHMDPKVTKYEDGTVIGICWDSLHKGSPIGNLPYSVSSYVASNGRCPCIRFTTGDSSKLDDYSRSCKIHLTGVKNNDEVFQISHVLIKTLMSCRETYNIFIENKNHVMKAVKWIEMNCVGDPVLIKQYSGNDHVIQVINYRKEYKINWPLIEDVPPKLRFYISKLYLVACNVPYISGIYPYAEQMINAKPPCDEILSVAGARMVMANANYSLGGCINRLELSEFLLEQGYIVTFINDIFKYMEIEIADEEANGIMRNEEGPENKILFNVNGTIRHSGTGSIGMENAYINLMLSVIEYVLKCGNENEVFRTLPT